MSGEPAQPKLPMRSVYDVSWAVRGEAETTDGRVTGLGRGRTRVASGGRGMVVTIVLQRSTIKSDGDGRRRGLVKELMLMNVELKRRTAKQAPRTEAPSDAADLILVQTMGRRKVRATNDITLTGHADGVLTRRKSTYGLESEGVIVRDHTHAQRDPLV